MLLARSLVPAGVVALALLVAACGDDDDEPTAEQEQERLVVELAEDLHVETGGTLDEETSRCVADGLVDAVGVERFEEVVAAASDDDPDLRMQVIDVFASCDALEPLIDAP